MMKQVEMKEGFEVHDMSSENTMDCVVFVECPCGERITISGEGDVDECGHCGKLYKYDYRAGKFYSVEEVSQ